MAQVNIVIAAHASNDPRSAEAMRVAPRRIVSIAAEASSSALGHVRVEVVDISRLGCRAEINGRLAVDDFVMVRLPGLAPLGARVAWGKPTAAGLEFASPLGAAVLDHLLMLYPGVRDED